MKILIALALVGAFFFQIWVTIRLWKSDLYIRSEKSAQSKLVWLVPVLGAVIVLSILTEETRTHTTDYSEEDDSRR